MRLLSRTTLIVGAAAVACLASPALAGSSVDRATGGGQIWVASDGRGPGDTITFQARGTSAAATGSVNVIDRTAGATTGRGQGYHFKGTVTCLLVSGTTAKLAGTGTGPEGETGFTLIVTDNGEGSKAPDSDMIALQYTDDPTCSREDGDDDSETDLARGNAQVYDAS